jgi:SAM-dependent methyltransferase
MPADPTGKPTVAPLRAADANGTSADGAVTAQDLAPAANDGSEEVWDLARLAEARRFGDWLFSTFASDAHGRVAEVGAGIGTYSARLLDNGIRELTLVEPEPACDEELRQRFGDDDRVTIAAESLPDAPSLVGGDFDFVLCLNVVEHIADDYAAVQALADGLKPGGRLGLLVPAHPRLFGALDRAYGHERRYTRARLRALLEAAGLDVLDIHSFNALGILGWVVKNRTRNPELDPRSLRAYEKLLPLYRPIESRLRLPVGLSVIAHARRPA